MLTLLVIASSFIAIDANSCPQGTSQVGNIGAVGNGQIGSTMRGPQFTMDVCKSSCTELSYCKAFSYDNSEYYNVPQCTRYSQDTTSRSNSPWHPGADQVLCKISEITTTESAVTCPDGAHQVGDAGTYPYYPSIQFIPGNNAFITADYCLSRCRNNPQCGAFTYDEDSNYEGGDHALCVLYADSALNGPSGDIHSSHPRADQLLCALDSANYCPSGSTQIGGPGATIYSINYDAWWRLSSTTGDQSTLTAQVCQNNCAADGRCRSFVYDADYQYQGGSQAVCILYNTNQQVYGGDDFGRISEYHPRADQVLCGMSSSALSPGLFNFDVDGNGEPVQLSVYIIYGVIGLVLVNIICMVIYCWNKCNKGSNRRRYKVVSMRSDIDTDVENQ